MGSNTVPKKKHLAALGGVLLFGLVVQLWLVGRTPVSSIDSVRFISIAQSIDSEGLLSVLRSDREQPLFPLLLCGVHHVLESLGVDRTIVWMRSAQVASVLGILLAIPAIYLVALRMAGRQAALLGTAVFVLLPEVARIGADGVADALHLALAAWAVVLLGIFWDERTTKGRGAVLLLGAGLLAALALLVRVEAVVIAGAVWLSLGFFSNHISRGACPRAKKKNGKMACLWFGLGLAVLLVPYLVLCGTYQPSQAVGRLLGRAASQESDRAIINTISQKPGHHALQSEGTVSSHTRTLSNLEVPGLETFTVKEPDKSIRHRGFGAAVGKVAEEVADLFGYWPGLLALVGVWTLRKRRPEALDRFAWILIGLLLAVVIWFTAKEGYVTARHLLLMLIPSMGSLGVGILAIGEWLGGRFSSVPSAVHSQRNPLPMKANTKTTVVTVSFVLILMLLGLVPPHRAQRSAYREVGCWLAREMRKEPIRQDGHPTMLENRGTVFDTRGWTSLFSAMPTYQADRAKEAFADPRLEYVVVMEEELLGMSDRSRTLRTLLDQRARRVARFTSPDARRETDALIVYRCLTETRKGFYR